MSDIKPIEDDLPDWFDTVGDVVCKYVRAAYAKGFADGVKSGIESMGKAMGGDDDE